MKVCRSLVLATSVTLASMAPHGIVMAQPAPSPSDEQLKEEEYAKDANTEINVKNAEIASIIRIFSRKTKRNYILDEKVKGKVSIYLPGKVSAEESLRILDSVLALKGFTAVPIGENLWKIVPSKEARQTTIPTITNGRTDEEGKAERPSASVVTRLLKLKYVSADDVQQIVSQLVSSDGLVNAYTGTNSLILIDSEDNIERLVKLIDELDVPFSNREMTIIPIKYAVVDDIAQKLSDILGIAAKGGGGGTADGAAAARARLVGVARSVAGGFMPPQPGAGGARQASTGKTVTASGVEPKIIPDQRTNSLIVVADDDTTARVRALVAQLDSKLDQSGNKFYVYRCQHANAEELAQVLAGLAGTGGAGMGGRAQGGGAFGAGGALGSTGMRGGAFGGSSTGGGAFGSSGMSGRNGSMGSRSSFGGSSGFGSGAGTGGGAFGGDMGRGGMGGRMGSMSAQLGENISLTADPATNSLIIAASKNDYEKIRALLAQLDVKRRQVIVESTLLEVSIDNNMRMSTGFLTSTGGADGGVLARSDFAAGDKGSLTSLFTNPEKLQGFTLAAASAGSLTLPGGLKIPTQTLLVSAAQQNNNVNVLSSPTILSTDNEPAQIVVGQNVPFLASTSTNATNLNNTFNQVDRQDVGITLRITPQISSRDYVNMRIFTEVSALVLSTVNSTLGPTTTKRQSETTIIAKDGQMIVTGGLIADDVSETDEGVPFLKDIPVLGHAFKSNSQSRVQKNLLIFMTPRIVKDQFDARDMTIESRDRMEDVIANYGVEPLRKNVLRDDSIDAVAETNPYDGPSPGTILPPEKPKREESRSKATQPNRTVSREEVVVDGNASAVVDLSADNGDPKGTLDLSVVEGGDAPVVVGATQDSTLSDDSHKVGKLPAPETLIAGEQFIVMQIQGDISDTEQIPFLLGNKGKIVGVKVPEESAEGVKRFFQSGERYVYRWKDSQVVAKVLGTYNSIPAAISSHPNAPEAWYTLSPYEIMNLGNGPWAKERD